MTLQSHERYDNLPATRLSVQQLVHANGTGNIKHYDEVIMCAMASQITSLTIVCSTVDSDADQRDVIFRVTGLCGNSPGNGEFPAQMASNAENASIWWRHHASVTGGFRSLRACDVGYKGLSRRDVFMEDNTMRTTDHAFWFPLCWIFLLRRTSSFWPRPSGLPFITAPVLMTSSNGNIFRVTGLLCGEFTGPGEFPKQRPVTRSFNVFFDLCLNKRLSKQSWGWWFETLSGPL